MAMSRSAELVGHVVGGRYRVLRPVGSGSSAEVFAADDVRLRRRVAVKAVRPHLADDASFRRRLRMEAQLVARLQHDHILAVYDLVDEDDGGCYLITELLEGGSLLSLFDSGARLTPSQAAILGRDVAEGLDYAHRRGVVHRDIKPGNLLFDRTGSVKIADFGLARALAEAATTEPLGWSETAVGTALYSSPEQVRGDLLDGRSDVYSLALVMVEALTGAVPFARDTPDGTRLARIGRPLPVPIEAGALSAVLVSAGTPEPSDRATAGDLVDQLERALRRLPPPTPLPLAPGTAPGDDRHPTEYRGRPRLFDAEAQLPVILQPDEANGPPGEAVPLAGTPFGARGPQAGTGLSEGGGSPNATAAPDPATRARGGRRRWVIAAAVLLVGCLAGVGLWIGTRPEPVVAVPALVRVAEAKASVDARADDLALTVAGSAYDPSVPAGAVLTQFPAPRTRVRRGGRISVILSKGPAPVSVPSLVGEPEAAAVQILQGLHLQVRVQEATSMTQGPGLVISSSPDSGTLPPGQTVTVIVSTGKPKVSVPVLSAIQTQSYTAAAAALQAAGLGAAQALQYSDTVARGTVVSLTPSSGSSVDTGSVVTVTISQGPHLAAVPDVANLSVGSATQRLQLYGFAVSGVTGNPLGTVVRTSPPAGSVQHYGSAVQIYTG